MNPELQSERTLSLGEALPAEMARVRDVVMPAYVEIGMSGKIGLMMMRASLDEAAKALAVGMSGKIGLMMMRASLDEAAKALAEGDVVAMIRCYEDLKGWKL